MLLQGRAGVFLGLICDFSSITLGGAVEGGAEHIAVRDKGDKWSKDWTNLSNEIIEVFVAAQGQLG